MRWRRYMILMLPLAVASSWLIVVSQKGVSAEKGKSFRGLFGPFYSKIPAQKRKIKADLKEGRHEPWEGRRFRDLFGPFYSKIPAQKRKIKGDLKKGRHEPWEGAFSDGGPWAGLSRGWIISRKKGYVSTTRRMDMGSVKVKGNRIALVSAAPNNAWGLMPVEYVVVRWDRQVFLVEPDQLLKFCNEVNSGKLRHETPSGGGILYRVKDFDKKRPTGLPYVPPEFKEYLLRKPITGSVVKIGEDKQDVAVRGKKWFISGTSLTLNVGKKDGVRTGMEFYPEGDSESVGFSRFYVISLAERQCELLQGPPLLQQQDNRKYCAKVGLLEYQERVLLPQIGPCNHQDGQGGYLLLLAL
jgi:hypothetical protein